MSKFGEYITNEYGILLRILTYLPSKSLVAASRVCKEWETVALRLILKRNKPYGRYQEHWSKWKDSDFDDQIHPKVILHFMNNRICASDSLGMCKAVSKNYDVDDSVLYIIRNRYFMASDYTEDNVEVNFKLGKKAQAYLALCDMPGVNIDSMMIPHTKEDFEELSKHLSSIRPKCALIITGGNGKLNLNISPFGSPFLVAGGIAEAYTITPCLRRADEKFLTSLVVTFQGENVIPHIALHRMNQDLEKFMKKFARDVGPIPPNGLRIAFVFSCINRMDLLEDDEYLAFTKHFPDVPLYGLWSFGEYLARIDERFNAKKDFLHSDCSAYLIITFKREA